MRRVISLLVACGLATAGVARAQSLDKEMAALASSLTKALVAQGSKNVAAIDFTDLQGRPTELGRYLSERVAVEIVSVGGVSMVDRANIKSILAEHKLTEAGLVNPSNAKKLGEFAGVDAILIGNVTALDGIELMVKAISTDSARIVAAGRITFRKTSDIQQLLNRGISASPTAGPTATPAASRTVYQAANAIATMDIGSLRLVLKSVVPMKPEARGRNGLRLSFAFISLETHTPLVVAANAEAGMDGRSVRSRFLGDVLRTTLVDDRGTVWRSHASGLSGLSVVSVGNDERGQPLSPSEIVRVLQRRDETGSDTYPRSDLPFVYGAMTQIPPGQSVAVVMSFVQDDGETVSGPRPKFFQIVSEIVVGVLTSDTKTSYSLPNLTFDRVSLPSGGGR